MTATRITSFSLPKQKSHDTPSITGGGRECIAKENTLECHSLRNLIKAEIPSEQLLCYLIIYRTIRRLPQSAKLHILSSTFCGTLGVIHLATHYRFLLSNMRSIERRNPPCTQFSRMITIGMDAEKSPSLCFYHKHNHFHLHLLVRRRINGA